MIFVYMKKVLIIIAVVVTGLSVWGFSSTDTNAKDEQLLLTLMGNVLKENHYNKLKIDDDFSGMVFNLYIQRLDYNKMYFLDKDIKSFEKYRKRLDDDFFKADLSFYNDVKSTFDLRFQEAENIVVKILEKDFDFGKEEYYETDPEKRTYLSSTSELEDLWRKYLKNSVLNAYLGKLENQEKALAKGADSTGSEYEIKTEEELLEDAIKSTRKNMTTRFKRRNEVDEEDNFAIYLNALANAYGPHTSYFPPQEKENFDMRMTGRLEGIGAVLQQSDGYIKIRSIVTGSACWKQGELEVDDLILKVAQADGEPEDIVDAPMKEVLSLIRGPKGTEVRLTVQKKDGGIKVIPIVRDVVIREETYAKSAVIKNKENGKKYGYIYLPGFYSKFGRQEGRSSAEDVDSELEKLKKENVEGIVLDLRNNGGGSLPDAIEMAGLFIKEGPIVQVKTTGQRAQIKSDFNSNITYDGPLVIMVNTFSASASEIVSAALKDYHRAYIVGSPSTYGKGTVQTFTDLNHYIRPESNISTPFGSLKFTVQQFYRINGSSTQSRGVRSDIELPDMYDISEVGERSLEYSLPWDSVDMLNYTLWDQIPVDLNIIRERSQSRMSELPTFELMNERITWVNEESDKSKISLKYDDVKTKRDVREKMNKKFEAIKKDNDELVIRSLQEILIEGDTVAKTRIENWEKQISKDFYLHETFEILTDIIEFDATPQVADEDKKNN